MDISIDDLILELKSCEPSFHGCDPELINFDPEKGIIPRCLVVETGEQGEKAAVVVGANPSRAIQERKYIGNANTNREAGYDRWYKNFKKTVLLNYCYFTGARGFVRSIGIEGDILWTETYKCENHIDKNKKLRIGSFHSHIADTCSSNYLYRELKAFKKNHSMYTVVACGGDVFNFLNDKRNNDANWKELIPELIGIYHPSGGHSRGYFEDLFVPRKDYVLLDDVKKQLELLNDNGYVRLRVPR